MSSQTAWEEKFLSKIKQSCDLDDSLSFDDFAQDRNKIPRYKKTLFVLDYLPKWQFYIQFLVHVRNFRKDVGKKIDLLRLSDISRNHIKGYSRVIFAYHDPLRQLYPSIYSKSKKLEELCDSLGIEFFGRPNGLSNTSKSVMSRIWQQNNIPCVRQFKVNSMEDIFKIKDLKYPVFVRYDCGHDSAGRRRSELFYSQDELKHSDLFNKKKYNAVLHFRDKVVTEFYETVSIDGLYRKFRTIVAGQETLNEAINMSSSWFVHRRDTVLNRKFVKEHLNFQNQPLSQAFKKVLVKANNVLGLELSAIDWSVDKKNNIVLWEANAHPSWNNWIIHNEEYKRKYIHFIAKTMIK